MEEPSGSVKNIRIKESTSSVASFDDESRTATMLLFEPNTFGDLGRGNTYYPDRLVSQDNLSVFNGTLGYIDHAPPGKENLERSLRDVAFRVLDTYQEDGKPYAKVKFIDQRTFDLAKELKDVIGPSIQGAGQAISTKVNGKNINWVKRFKEGTRLDLVTAPGAGGRIINIKESATGGEDYMDNLTLEELEADEKGKEILVAVREAAANDAAKKVQETTKNLIEEAVAKAIKAKDEEIVKLREVATSSGSLEEQVKALKIIVEQQANKLNDSETARKVEVKIREAALPADVSVVVANSLSKLPEEDWDALLDSFKSMNKGTARVEGAGYTKIRESATSNFGGNLTTEAINKAAADQLGIPVEDYKKIDSRGFTMKM